MWWRRRPTTRRYRRRAPTFCHCATCTRTRVSAPLSAQGLLRELLALCGDAAGQKAAVLTALGQSLSARNLHEDAGVAFVAAGRLEAALNSYRAGGAFQMALALAGAP